MAAMARQTCSECGVVLLETSDALPLRCPACWAKSQEPLAGSSLAAHEKSGSTIPLAASQRTVILGKDDVADQKPSHHAQTIDFIPSADPTEPTPFATDARVARHERVGRFEIVSILGRGSFGTVYRAKDPLLDREVALKVPRFSSDDREMAERFHREARAAARLHHPNIVTLFENGQTADGPYLVNEFIDGIPLSQLLREQSVDLRVAVDWVRQIAEGLHYAHSEGIVHRDVKPANIMMDRSGRLQIMDFGLAKRNTDIESGMTMEGQIVGTPNYMSPEQARGAISEIGPHSDQYSVGVVLYEMLCGRPPFSGDPWTIIARVASMRENPPPPRSVKPDLPRDLEACCLKAMEKDPHARYPSLQALADDLDHWLKGQPLVARPIGPFEQLLRWCRQNRSIASLGGSLAAVFIIAAFVGPWLAYRFQELATAATLEANDANAARKLETSARLNAERVIADAYTEFGLTADRNGNPSESILWFANAAAAAENFPQREKHNRIRFQSWLPEITTPIQAFAQPASFISELSYHPSGDVLLMQTLAGRCELLTIADGSRKSVPVEEPIIAAVWSPDGQVLAVASRHEVIAFEFPANTERDRWNHADSVRCLQFSADGQSLVIGGKQTVQVRDVSSKSFRTSPLSVESPITAAAIAPNGNRVAVCCEDKQVRVFSTAKDSTRSDPLLPEQHSKSNTPPIFVNNDRLVIFDEHKFVRCWNLERASMIWEQEIHRVLASAISPDGKWLAFGEDFDVVLVNVESGEALEDRIALKNLVHCLSFHPQSSRLLVGGADKLARVFEVPSGKLVGTPILHGDAVHRGLWSPDGTTFATAHFSGDLIRVWNPSQALKFDSAVGSSESAPFIRFNQKGDRWLPSSFDNVRNRIEVEIFDASTGKPVGPKLSGPGLISDADFIPAAGQAGDPRQVVLVGGSSRTDDGRGLNEQKLGAPGFVRFVNSETAATVFADVITPSQPIAVRSSPDGQTVVVLCFQGQLLLLDPATGMVRAEHPAFRGQNANHSYVIRDRIRFSERGDQFVIWGSGETIELRKTPTGELLSVLSHTPHFVHDARFSPDGRLIATCGSNHSVRLWQATTGESVGSDLVHAGWVFNAQFSCDGKRLLTASSDKQARLWDVETGNAVVATREHSDQVFGVTFLPGEELFLVSGRDGQLTAWDATIGKMMAPSCRMPNMVYQLSLSSSGSHVIASGKLAPIRHFEWGQWIRQADTQLDREDVKLLGEILSSQRVHEGGVATSLTSAQWIERWEKFRTKYPQHPSLRIQQKPE